MEQELAPDGVELYAPRKRKWSEDNQHLDPQPGQGNASHMDIIEDGPVQNDHPINPTIKKSRLDASDETVQPTETRTNLASGETVLPPVVLQHAFSFLDPISISRLMSVSRLFNVLLDPRKPLPVSSTTGRLRLRNQNDIWSISRRAFLSAFPRPMDDMTEPDMWKLIRGISCQFCGRKPKGKAPLLANSPWSSGPGPEGVRAIWPFRVRACGSCLESRLVKVKFPMPYH